MPDRKPFYEEITNPSGGVDKRIVDPTAAQELADLEETRGRGIARQREGELLRQHETGFTDEQRVNIGVMEGLLEEYPDAFSVIYDQRGRKMALSEVLDDTTFPDEYFKRAMFFKFWGGIETDVILSQEGLAVTNFLRAGDRERGVTLEEVVDAIARARGGGVFKVEKPYSWEGKVDKSVPSFEVEGYRLNLRIPEHKESLRKWLTEANKWGAKRRARQEASLAEEGKSIAQEVSDSLKNL